MLLVHVPWAGRIMALPFLTLLAPSKRFYEGKPREHKTIVDWARQAVLQIHRWLPNRYIVLVADSAFAAIEFLAAVGKHVCVVTRLRLDANLFDPFSQTWVPARHLLSGLCQAAQQFTHSAVDQHYIAELHAHCTATQDAEIMRKTWSDLHAAHKPATDVQLSAYSQAMGSHLLNPMTHQPA